MKKKEKNKNETRSNKLIIIGENKLFLQLDITFSDNF